MSKNAHIELVVHISAKQVEKLIDAIIPPSAKTDESSSHAPKKKVSRTSNPGLALRKARIREGLTQNELALRAGVSRFQISRMENQQRPIVERMAKRLAEVLDVDYQIFLS